MKSLLKKSAYNFTGWGATGKRRTNEKQGQGSSCQFSVNKVSLTVTDGRDTSQGGELPVAEVSIKKECYRGDIKMDWRLLSDLKVPFCFKIVDLNK